MYTTSSVTNHFEKIAGSYDYYKNKNSFYYKNLKILLSKLIPRDKKVLEIGCGTGNLLYSLKPRCGYGIDISKRMIEISKIKYHKSKNLRFSTLWPSDNFDYIFMSDVIEHLENPRGTFSRIFKLMNKNTVFINTMANPIWEPVLMLWERMGWKMEEGKHRRIKYRDLKFMIQECGLKIVKHDYKLLVPVSIPVITRFANRYLEYLFKKYAFIEYFVATKS